NVDARSVVDQINKTFGELKGKRETPAPVPTLSPLRAEAVSIMTDAVRQDRLSIMWDTPWLRGRAVPLDHQGRVIHVHFRINSEYKSI
ncbi:MAG: Protein yhjJ, partial [Escherichia coli DORA_A_5_14_21]